MESSDKTVSLDFLYSSSSSDQFPHQGLILVQYPCAACKILRRRCSEKCILAPYFPPSEPLKFTIVHKIFGASNLTRRLQEIPEHKRADAVNSMVYEATARIRDPVYGCAGAVSLLQQRSMELQEELAKAQAEIFNLKSQNDSLMSSFYGEMTSSEQQQSWENTNNLSLDPFWNNLSLDPFWTYEDM